MYYNDQEIIEKHEYLTEENYYESKSVGTKARSHKICEYCGKNIKKGTPHYVAIFYPEYTGYPLHLECEDKFLKSLN